MLHIIIIGAPGCGKGKHSANITKKYDLIHISTGELLREEVELQTQLGAVVKKYLDKGFLVPDDLVTQELVINFNKYKDQKGFLFDGYPRTLFQAKYLDELFSQRKREISLVLSMEVEEAELFKRILHRSEKSKRSDDTEEVIKNRLAVYRQQTLPLLNYYDTQKKLYRIDGMAAEEVVFKRIIIVIDDYIKKNF